MNQSNERTTSMSKTKGLVQMAIFAALIVVLAFTPFIGYIPLGFTRATIIHIPVIMGSLMLGPKKGAALGGVFGLTSFINNTINPTLTSFVFTPFYSLGEYSGGIGSLIICFVPRILIGVVPFYVYRLVKKLSKNNGVSSVGLVAAGLSGALTNTLLVMNLIFVFFRNDYAAANGVTVKAVYGFILSIIGINGIPEAIVAAVKATVAAVKGIVAAIAAGGWVAVVVVLLICAVGLVFGGVYSYVSKEEADSERSLYQLVSVAESEYYDEIERLKSEYAYDLCDTTGTCVDRRLAVVAYLVERNLIGQNIVFDDARSEDFKQFYRLLHTSTLHSETVLQTETVWEQQEDGTLAPVERKVEKTKLYVNITSLNAEQIADYFDFDDGEKKCFEGLLQVNFE